MLATAEVVCPACGRETLSTADMDPTTGMVRCACGHEVFAGYIAESAYLHGRGEWLRARIEDGDGPLPAPLMEQYHVWDPRPRPLPAAPTTPAPTHSTGIQTVLLSLGALLLVTAASVFTAVAWPRLGANGQLLVAVAATVGVSSLAVLLRRRLRGTAEALAALGFGLVVVDLVAAPVLGVVPETWTDVTSPYATIALTVLAVVGLAAGHSFGLRAWVWLGWMAVAAAAGAGTALLAERADGGASTVVLSLTVTAVVGLLLLTATWVVPSLAVDRRPTVTAGLACLIVAGVAAGSTVLDAGVVGEGAAFSAVSSLVLVLALWRIPTPRPAPLRALAGVLLGTTAALVLALPLPDVPLVLAAAAGVAGGVTVVGLLLRGRGVVGLVVAVPLWVGWVQLATTTTRGVVGETPEAVVDAIGVLLVVVAASLAVAAWLARGSGTAAALAWTAASVLVLGGVLLVPDGYPTVVEAWSIPIAATLLGAGWLASRERAASSLERLGPAMTALLVPSALMTWTAPWVQGAADDTTSHVVRLVLLLLAGTVASVVGARRHLLGLVLPAAASLTIAGAAQIWTGLEALPRWVALALAGLVLVVTGARLEWVRDRGRQTGTWVRGLS